MIENTLLDKLEELKQQFSAFEQSSHEDRVQARALLARDLAGLHRTLDELQTIAAEPAATNVTEPAATNVTEPAATKEVLPIRGRSRSFAERDPEFVSLDAVLTLDHEGVLIGFDSAAEALFGYRGEDVIGRAPLDLLVPPRMRPQVLSAFLHYRAAGKTAMLGKRLNSFAMRADGSEFPVEVAMTAIGIGKVSVLTIHVCDATARKRAEQEVWLYQERLRSLTTDLLLVEEHERRRLAIDLHDGLSQTIALTQIKLSALRRSMNGQLERALDEIADLVDQTDRAARLISFELSPPVLHDLGLQPALLWLVENLQARYGIEIVLEDDGRPKPADEKTRVILFRSIRELLINAAKHAGAHRVRVRLEREEDRLKAAIEDDGIGMEPDTAAVNGSGLFSIHERLSYVGGSMQIESAPGRGTRIRLCAPLAHETSQIARIEA